MVVSLPELRGTIKTGCHKWKELLSSMSIYYELPWERKRLVEAATHHLESEQEEFCLVGRINRACNDHRSFSQLGTASL